jgi:hypothetical protein
MQYGNNYQVGRTYGYYTVEPAEKRRLSGLMCLFIFFLIGTIISVSFWIYYEVKTDQDLKEIEYIKNNLIELPIGQAGVSMV